uniref:Uncharacterized protein n=1 Tax=Sphaerodactylus townsendi TaxID=933632 RepID=A0ACB8E9F7_9SAUR
MLKASHRRHESPVLRMGKILSCDWLAGRVEATEIPHSAGFSLSATQVRQLTQLPSRAQKFNGEGGGNCSANHSQGVVWLLQPSVTLACFDQSVEAYLQ